MDLLFHLFHLSFFGVSYLSYTISFYTTPYIMAPGFSHLRIITKTEYNKYILIHTLYTKSRNFVTVDVFEMS